MVIKITKLMTSLVTEVTDDITRLFEQTFTHFSETLKVNASNVPLESRAFIQWSAVDYLPLLMQRYQNGYYDNKDTKPNDKALYSLWTQWYFGLVIPPMILMLLEYPKVVDTHHNLFQLDFNSNGRPNIFYYKLCWLDGYQLSLLQRHYSLLDRHVIPVVEKIVSYQKINARLLWNNISYIIFWYLNEFRKRISNNLYQEIIYGLFFTPLLPDGRDNPLYRTVIIRNNSMLRRGCCQRNKLPGVGNCHDCPLEIIK